MKSSASTPRATTSKKDDKAAWAKDKSAVAKFVDQEKITYPILVDGDSLSQEYGGLDAMPTSFFVDRKGTVVAAQMGLTSEAISSPISRRLWQISESQISESRTVPGASKQL